MKSVREAARWLGVSIATIYALCSSRKLKHYRLGLKRGKIVIDDNDLAAFRDGLRIDAGDQLVTRSSSKKSNYVFKHLRLT